MIELTELQNIALNELAFRTNPLLKKIRNNNNSFYSYWYTCTYYKYICNICCKEISRISELNLISIIDHGIVHLKERNLLIFS